MTTENVLGWLLVCIGAVLLVATAWLLALARRSSAWPSTPGRIVSSRCESCEGPRFGRSTYRLAVTYAFEVAGHHVEGHRVAFGDNLWGSRSKEEVEEQVKFFHPGREVTVVHGRPRFAKHSVRDDPKVKIAPVHPDFRCETRSLSLMGSAGQRLDRLHALWVPRPPRAVPTTV